MPIPASQQLHIELQANGQCGAGGSNARSSISVWQFKRTTTVNPLVKANVEAAFQTAIMIPVTNALNARYVQTYTTVRILDDALDYPTQVTRAVAGQIAGECLTTVESLYLLARSNLRGGSYRGSKKLFPFSESDTTLATADLWNAAALARFATIAAAWLAGFTDSDGNIWKPVVLSRLLSTLTPNPTNIVANQIATVLVNKRVGAMIHRKVKSVY